MHPLRVHSLLMAKKLGAMEPERTAHLTDKPLRRRAGQSLSEKLYEKTEGLLHYIVGCCAGLVISSILAAVEIAKGETWPWWKPPAYAIGFSALLAPLFYWFEKPNKALVLGELGERIVGDALESLQELQYCVFHDLRSEKRKSANIDHVVIGPGGIYVIETKARSKIISSENASGYRDPRAIVEYTGDKLIVAGHDETTQTLGQVRAIRQEVRQLVARTLDMSMEEVVSRGLVRGVVMYPGFFVQRRVENRHPEEVWVMQEHGLHFWLPKEPVRLSRSEVEAISIGLRAMSQD